MIHKPRLLFYLPTGDQRDLHRYLAIARQLTEELPGVRQKLLVKTTPQVALPPAVELALIPPDPPPTNRPHTDPSLREAKQRREAAILDLILHFHPDLLLVDRLAPGLGGEILPALRFLKVWSPHTKIVYGMPDVHASPWVIQSAWQRDGTYRLLDELYDSILFYGQRDLFDPVRAYQLPHATAAKVTECGYLRDGRAPSEAESAAPPAQRHDGAYAVLAAIDSLEAMDNCLQFFHCHQAPHDPHSPRRLTLLVDPHLTIRQVRDFLTAMASYSVDVVSFDLSLAHHYIDAADLVICSPSYDSVGHVLGRGRQVLYLIGPQTPPDQLQRAHALFNAGLAHVCDLTEASPFFPAGVHGRLDNQTALSAPPLRLDGVRRAGRALASMMATVADRRTIL